MQKQVGSYRLMCSKFLKRRNAYIFWITSHSARFEATMSNCKSKKENSASQFLSFDYDFYYYYFT